MGHPPRDNNRTQNFDYDNLNRIAHAYTTGANWGEAFTIDAWGNLTNIGSYPGKTNTENLNAAPASVKNQLNGFCHDAPGNLVLNAPCPTGTFTPTYNYDIENRLSTTGTYSYVYDGDGQRVKKCSSAGCTAGTLYWRDTSGEPLLEAGVGGTGTEEYVYFNGKRVARRDITGSVVHYCFADHLGSATVVTNATGTTPFDEDLDYYPYGGIVATSSDTVPQHYKFTGKERDSESGLDNFGARYSASSLGRFMSPDPKTISPLRMLDPQQWNRYAYARNSPLIYVDPDGKELRIAIYYKNVDEALARRVGSLISGNFEKAGVKNVSVELHKGSPNSLTVLDYSLPGTQSTMLELRKGKDTTSILGSSIPESEGGHDWGWVFGDRRELRSLRDQ